MVLESSLTQAIEILDERDIDHDLVEAEKSIIQMVESANSDEYYQLLHEWLLMLSDYDYDAHLRQQGDGCPQDVEVIKLIAGDSIEQRVIELQNIKKEVIKQVISDNDGSVTSASLEDIAFVLE